MAAILIISYSPNDRSKPTLIIYYSPDGSRSTASTVIFEVLRDAEATLSRVKSIMGPRQ